MVVSLADYRRPMQINMTIGERIRLARENQGMTLEQLAARCHTSKSNVSRWETGKQAITPEQVVLVARVLGNAGLVEHYCHDCAACKFLTGRNPKPAA